jgi:hypothetical protein
MARRARSSAPRGRRWLPRCAAPRAHLCSIGTRASWPGAWLPLTGAAPVAAQVAWCARSWRRRSARARGREARWVASVKLCRRHGRRACGAQSGRVRLSHSVLANSSILKWHGSTSIILEYNLALHIGQLNSGPQDAKFYCSKKSHSGAGRAVCDWSCVCASVFYCSKLNECKRNPMQSGGRRGLSRSRGNPEAAASRLQFCV